jgi:hypothetical protein
MVDYNIEYDEHKFIDGFAACEWSGRTFFNDMMLSRGNANNIHFTPTRFDKVDVTWDYEGNLYVGEIKYRPNYASTASCIANEGAMLEKHKFEELKNYQNNSGYTPYYIMFFSDGVCALYDLTDIEPEWVEEVNKYRKTTMGKDKSKITKVVTYLPLDKAKLFHYDRYVHNS